MIKALVEWRYIQWPDGVIDENKRIMITVKYDDGYEISKPCRIPNSSIENGLEKEVIEWHVSDLLRRAKDGWLYKKYGERFREHQKEAELIELQEVKHVHDLSHC